MEEIKLDKVRILAIERYGANPFKFSAQRDGFVEGYNKAMESSTGGNNNFRCFMEDLGHDDKCKSLCDDCRYNIHTQPPTK